MSVLSRPLRERSLDAIAAELAAGHTTSVALCEEALDAARDGRRPGTQVFIDLSEEKVLAQAQAMDILRASGQAPSPYVGIPISIKDLADVSGEVTAAGSKIHAEAPPAKSDAEVVRRLRQSGFVLFGRTNMTEYAYSGIGLNPHYGTAGNTLDASRAPGGSTAGGAVSVGLGMAAAALGSDTGGSVRAPSAFNGLAGFKPTASTVPTAGVFPLSTTLDSIGPLAATVRCCAALHGVFSGTSPEAPHVPVDCLRLAVPSSVLQDGLDEVVAPAFERALKMLRDAGATLVPMETDVYARIFAISSRIHFAAAEAFAIHRDNIRDRPDDFDFRVRERIKPGGKMLAADYAELLWLRERLIAEHTALMAGFDAVLSPTCPIIAPKIDALEADVDLFVRTNLMALRNTSLFNWLDGCGASVPIQAEGEQGVGLLVTGLTGTDWRTLAVAETIEAIVRRV